MNVKFIGVREIDKVLQEMPKALTHSVMQRAHADAAKPMLARMQQLAPVGATKNLVNSLGIVKTSIKRANEIGEVQLGARRTRTRRGQHAHLIEFGTRRRRTRRGANRGIGPEKPFERPAFTQTRYVVIGRIATSTGKVLIRTMKKYAPR